MVQLQPPDAIRSSTAVPMRVCTLGGIDIVLATRVALGNLYRLNGPLGQRTNRNSAAVSSTM